MSVNKRVARSVAAWVAVWVPIVFTNVAFAAAPEGVGAVTNFINSIATVLLALCGAVAIIYIMIGGFNFMTSKSDPQKLMGAKDTLVHAGVGLVIVVAAKVIEVALMDIATKAFGN